MSAIARRLSRTLSSPRCAQGVMIAWFVLLTAWLVPLQFFGLPGERVRHLAYAPLPFAPVYAGLVVLTLSCMLKRFKGLRRRVSTQPRLDARPGGEDLVLHAPFDRERTRRALRRAGYRRIVIGEDRAWALRFPYGPLGSIVLHLSIVLVVLGAIATLVPDGSFVGRARVTEGDTFTGTQREYFEGGHGTTRGETGVGPRFTVGSVIGRASGGLPPDHVSVVVSGAGPWSPPLTAGLPWLAGPTTMVAVEDFGFTPRMSLTPSGGVLPAATVSPALQLARSPVEESVKVSMPSSAATATPTVYRLGIRMVSGADSTHGNRPRLLVAVARREGEGWRLESEPATVAAGESRRFGSVTLRLEEVRPNAVFRITRSAAMPLVALGILGASLGALLRLAFPRTEAVLAEEPNGRTSLRVSVDAYRTTAWAAGRIERAWQEVAK